MHPDIVLADCLGELLRDTLQESLPILTYSIVVLGCTALQVAVWKLLQEFLVQVHGYVGESSDDSEDLSRRDSGPQLWINDVPEFFGLRLVVPVFAEEPTEQAQVLHSVLAVFEREVAVEVCDGLRTSRIFDHSFVVNLELWRYFSHVLGCHI